MIDAVEQAADGEGVTGGVADLDGLSHAAAMSAGSARAGAKRRGAVPVFLWLHGPQASDTFYGFPAQPDDGRVKVATEQYAIETSSADALDRRVAASEGADLFETHLRGRLSGLSSRPARSVVCVYTSTPDGRFIIDTMPDNDNVVVVSACSGHGFKHSPAIGEHVSALVQSAESAKPEFAFEQ